MDNTVLYEEEKIPFGMKTPIEKSKFGSSSKVTPRYNQNDENYQQYTPHVVQQRPADLNGKNLRQSSLVKSYVDSEFISPKSGSESVSVPLNFTSENDVNGRSSMYSSSMQDMVNSRSKRLWKAGASIISGGLSTPMDKKTTVRIRGKQTGKIIAPTV